MLNPRFFYNSRPDGFGVLEIAGDERDKVPRRFAPLTRTDLAGDITGPLAALRLTQTFAVAGEPDAAPVEALYRFPLPGDAAVTGVTVRFGDVEIQTVLKERSSAESEYESAKREGRQAALLTRESPDVFTLAVAGIRPGQQVRVETAYVQLARAEGDAWSLRIPLTTGPRYVRADEAGSRHAAGQPLSVLRDPGHRFALDVAIRGAAEVTSKTHPLAVQHDGDQQRLRLRDGDVIPDRDCVLTWRTAAAGDRPALQAWVHPDPKTGHAYFLALCMPPAISAQASGVAREVILLVDHSGSMEGPKWAAADWAVERFLAGLTEHDAFTLGVFHDSTRWFAREPRPATAKAVAAAVEFLKSHRDSGGTELGVALEQALDTPRAAGARARHVLVITDAEVTDAGRLLALADREADRPDRRRVSVLCVDAAPNAALAAELAERGGGVSRFLTSDPAENDVTTAMDEVLADWSAPPVLGLALEVNRPTAEAVGRSVSLRVPGPSTAIDLGDPPAGRPVWAAGRVPLDGERLTFRLQGKAAEAIARTEADAGGAGVPGLKALFGAQRVRRLEYLQYAGLGQAELRAELERLGYAPKPAAEGGDKLYPENARADVRVLLVREALDFGLPSAKTAFVAVRSEAGRPVGETIVVANALPAGWSEGFIGAAAGAAQILFAACPAPAPARGFHIGGMAKLRSASAQQTGGRVMARMAASGPAAAGAGEEKAGHRQQVRISVPAGSHAVADGAVLFDSRRDAGKHSLPDAGRLTSLQIALRGNAVADNLGREFRVLLFIGDAHDPRAAVRVVDLLRSGERPLNVQWAAGQAVRLILDDPDGAWKDGVPALELTLGWSE